jgi:hypothetical protein
MHYRACPDNVTQIVARAPASPRLGDGDAVGYYERAPGHNHAHVMEKRHRPDAATIVQLLRRLEYCK